MLSSHWEGLPLVLAEAVAVGTPVVSTDCPNGPREILDGGRYGVLVPVDNLDAMAGAMREVLTSDAKCAELRAASAEGAERMSIRPRAKQLGELFWRVLTERGYERAAAPTRVTGANDEPEFVATR